MSCSIVALPAALIWVVGSLTVQGAAAIGFNKMVEPDVNMVLKEIHQPDVDNMVGFREHSDITLPCDDINVINEETLLTKSLETPFNDKDILIKTLEEHGISITTNSDVKVEGKFDKYILSFEKNDMGKPFYLTARYNDEKCFNQTIEDISSEYAMNVQENTYIELLEKLKENNMEIETEEVLEDNTIVLTVNLEE